MGIRNERQNEATDLTVIDDDGNNNRLTKKIKNGCQSGLPFESVSVGSPEP